MSDGVAYRRTDKGWVRITARPPHIRKAGRVLARDERAEGLGRKGRRSRRKGVR